MSSSTPEINTVPMHFGHSHFYNWIEFGDHLPVGDSLEDQHKKTMTKLRGQLLHDNTNFEQKLCFRNCFKLQSSKYVDFCLQKKCGGVSFEQAATTLGYVNQPQTQTQASHGHAHH